MISTVMCAGFKFELNFTGKEWNNFLFDFSNARLKSLVLENFLRALAFKIITHTMLKSFVLSKVKTSYVIGFFFFIKIFKKVISPSGSIVLSWFVSPLLSGLISIVIYATIKKFILSSKKAFTCGLFALPIIYGLTIFINVLSVTLDGSKRMCVNAISLYNT